MEKVGLVHHLYFFTSCAWNSLFFRAWIRDGSRVLRDFHARLATKVFSHAF